QRGVVQHPQRPLAVGREVRRLVRQPGEARRDVPLGEEDVVALAGERVPLEALDHLRGGGGLARSGRRDGCGEEGGPDKGVTDEEEADDRRQATRTDHGRLLVRTAKENGGTRAGSEATGAPFSALKIRTRGEKKLPSATSR